MLYSTIKQDLAYASLAFNHVVFSVRPSWVVVDFVVTSKTDTQKIPRIGQPVSKSASFVVYLFGQPRMANLAHGFLF